MQNDTLVTMETAGSELKQLTDDYEKNQELIKTLKKLLKVYQNFFIFISMYFYTYCSCCSIPPFSSKLLL